MKKKGALVGYRTEYIAAAVCLATVLILTLAALSINRLLTNSLTKEIVTATRVFTYRGPGIPAGSSIKGEWTSRSVFQHTTDGMPICRDVQENAVLFFDDGDRESAHVKWNYGYDQDDTPVGAFSVRDWVNQNNIPATSELLDSRIHDYLRFISNDWDRFFFPLRRPNENPNWYVLTTPPARTTTVVPPDWLTVVTYGTTVMLALVLSKLVFRLVPRFTRQIVDARPDPASPETTTHADAESLRDEASGTAAH